MELAQIKSVDEKVEIMELSTVTSPEQESLSSESRPISLSRHVGMTFCSDDTVSSVQPQITLGCTCKQQLALGPQPIPRQQAIQEEALEEEILEELEPLHSMPFENEDVREGLKYYEGMPKSKDVIAMQADQPVYLMPFTMAFLSVCMMVPHTLVYFSSPAPISKFTPTVPPLTRHTDAKSPIRAISTPIFVSTPYLRQPYRVLGPLFITPDQPFLGACVCVTPSGPCAYHKRRYILRANSVKEGSRITISHSDNILYFTGNDDDNIAIALDNNLTHKLVSKGKIKNMAADRNSPNLYFIEGNGIFKYEFYANHTEKLTDIMHDLYSPGKYMYYVDNRIYFLCVQFSYTSRICYYSTSDDEFTTVNLKTDLFNVTNVTDFVVLKHGHYYFATDNNELFMYKDKHVEMLQRNFTAIYMTVNNNNDLVFAENVAGFLEYIHKIVFYATVV